jgi:antitoxin component of RelBE/YafQ-DinJ toxin-antitoxin module
VKAKETDVRARISAKLKLHFDATCELKDTTMSDVLRELIEQYVSDNANAEIKSLEPIDKPDKNPRQKKLF